MNDVCLLQVGVTTRLLFDGEKDPAIRQRHKTGGLHGYGHTGLLDEYVYTVYTMVLYFQVMGTQQKTLAQV